jgi:hypothetical protein|nr:MAG TPA: hypothetical protein [Caudoviricetes sp.]
MTLMEYYGELLEKLELLIKTRKYILEKYNRLEGSLANTTINITKDLCNHYNLVAIIATDNTAENIARFKGEVNLLNRRFFIGNGDEILYNAINSSLFSSINRCYYFINRTTANELLNIQNPESLILQLFLFIQTFKYIQEKFLDDRAVFNIENLEITLDSNIKLDTPNITLVITDKTDSLDYQIIQLTDNLKVKLNSKSLLNIASNKLKTYLLELLDCNIDILQRKEVVLVGDGE